MKGASQPTAHLPTSLTIGTAEHDLGMCSGKTGARTAAKTRQMEFVEPQPVSPPASPPRLPLTHKSLVYKVFCKVDQHQRDDVSQEALEESGDMSGRQEAEDPHRAPTATIQTLNTVHLSWRERSQLAPTDQGEGRKLHTERLARGQHAASNQPAQQCVDLSATGLHT